MATEKERSGMKVISLGAGVQSTTMYLMSCYGDLPRADRAIFADTGWEPRGVYAHLERLVALDEIPIDIVRAGNLRDDALSSTRFASMPLFTRDRSGTISMLRRQCTREYKVQPLQSHIRKLGASAKDPAEVWIGISTDEIQQMKDSRVRYTTVRWPLIEMRMDRNACRKYLDTHGWKNVPKSACIGCPFHDNAMWGVMKREQPAEFADAVLFDRAIRNMPRLQDETYLHRSATPLDEVQFEFETGQGDLFLDDCDGMCGV